jgi:flavoprotein
LYPVDQFDEEIEALGPKGEQFKIRPRKVDLENVQRLIEMERVIVLKSPLEILSQVESILKLE